MKQAAKHPENMSYAELAKATKKFDLPYIFEKSRSMSVAESDEESRLRRSRPKIQKRAKNASDVI
jgi:hypothetical protein